MKVTRKPGAVQADAGAAQVSAVNRRYIPPTQMRRGWLWLTVAMLLAGMVTPLLSGLGDAPVVDAKETSVLSLGSATWERARSMADEGVLSVDRWVPAEHGQKVLDRAPGMTWALLSAWWTADPATTSDEELIFRGRLTSVMMTLLALGSAYWAGYSLGGMKSAVVAGLVVMSCPVVIMTGRLATEDSHVMGWSMLAAAGALWAMRPMKPSASIVRQGLGWALCGGALGLAVLCGGVDAALPAALPLAAVALVGPRRPGNLLGLGAAGAIAALVVGPWVVYVHQGQLDTAGEAWRAWAQEAGSWWALPAAVGSDAGSWWAALVSVWGLWVLLVGMALVWPWLPMASAVGGRRKALVGWVWLVSVIALAAIGSGELADSAWVMLGPVAGVAIGQTLAGMSEAVDAGRRLKIWRWAGVPTAVGIVLISIALPVMLTWQASNDSFSTAAGGWLAPMGDPAWTGPASVSGWYWLAVGLMLTAVAAAAAVWVLGDRPTRAAACWGAWHSIAVTALFLALLPGTANSNPSITGKPSTLPTHPGSSVLSELNPSSPASASSAAASSSRLPTP